MDEATLPGGIVPDGATDGAPEHDALVPPAIPVVGIGASAGGLDVFKRLLGRLPADSGLAIVFVQHLDPKHHSLLAEILSRATAMPVSEAADGMRVEANHVYVIPASVDLAIAGGALVLTPRTEAAGSHMPIDRFLRSVADQCGSRGIGVILSGTGSDGSVGLAAIKGAGGVTFAQDMATARFPAMPQAAAATGCVDFVLPPEGIAEELVRIGRHPYVAADRVSEGGAPSGDEEHFAGILAVLRAANGIDFSVYREKMVKRRILRRLALRNVDGLSHYRELLERDSSELAALQRDLLIGVTSFFRDADAFEHLKTLVFPRIVRGRTANETVRIWVAGCATGEEAFSIAIAITEYLQEVGVAVPVRVFASDINTPAIEKARRGRYAENITADISPERLARHFTKVEGGYQINKNLREMVIFSRHNLIGDPPFSKVDLITCRNVLIYLGRVQQDIIRLFHYALRSNGFLMLGASEAASADLFSPADPEQRIYSKREVARNRHVFPGALTVKASPGRSASMPPNAPSKWDGVDVSKAVDRILISKYSPAGVVVDDDLEVVEIRGKANPYLTLTAGKVSFNLIKLIPDTGLFLQVEKLIQEARKSGEPARQQHVLFGADGNADGLSVEVVPLDGVPTRCLVLFEPKPATDQPAATPDAAPEEDPRDREILRLKRQLTAAKERFLSVIETHQSSREESQNTTEEALSANEELQSLNEELETAKEELQSSNEELVTVNEELQHKNADLAQARDFAFSIVETIRQPLVVLDTDLRIRMANRAFYRTFQISPLEVEGQPIGSLSHGSWDVPRLQVALAGLVQNGNSFPDFEIEHEFPPVGRRTLVLGGCRINHLKMILLAIDDITERRLAQHAVKRSEDHLRQSQKMEAVGRLAGGIAHDFNNLLTAVIGYSSLLEDRLASDPSALQQVLQIKTAGERAASLTQQLLAFSRRQVLQPKVVDLNVIVAEFDKMLRRLVGERIRIIVNCDPSLWKVRADPGEIGRAIMNLALNARDAMPEGGALTIETANVTLAEGDAGNENLAPGRYVTLAVRDTGIGIDEEVQAHIFEPFFTTKETGKGTGLGLATVLGVVEQSGGAIRCKSLPAGGTTFRIFLPAITEAADRTRPPAGGLATAPKGSEVILLVEDEETVRKLARMILERSGYVVREAANGREGLAQCETYDGNIDLLLTDVVMPELGGRELADLAVKLRPNMKVLFMSGHTQDVVIKEGVKKGMAFLQKPFTPARLAEKVRDTLDRECLTAGQL